MNEHVSIAEVCLLAGKIMLESGAETYRVEDTMDRIAISYGLNNVQSYATPTAIHFSISVTEQTNFLRISKRSTDLDRIAQVNDISRKIAEGGIEQQEALTLLQNVDTGQFAFPVWLQILASALVSGSFAVMFGGTWSDFLPALIIGGIGFGAMLGADVIAETRFISEFFAGFVIGLLAIIFVHYGFGSHLDKVIIGAVMPLVPGLHITNAVRDLLAGHLVAGVSKGMEAILTAFAIGAGIAVVFAFL